MHWNAVTLDAVSYILYIFHYDDNNDQDDDDGNDNEDDDEDEDIDSSKKEDEEKRTYIFEGKMKKIIFEDEDERTKFNNNRCVGLFI